MTVPAFIETARLIISLLPLLIQVIKAVEEAIPGQGKGEAKLAAVRSMLEAASEAAGNTVDEFERLWPAIQRTIGALVDAFNKAGWS